MTLNQLIKIKKFKRKFYLHVLEYKCHKLDLNRHRRHGSPEKNRI